MFTRFEKLMIVFITLQIISITLIVASIILK